jgi:hypothetical protein
MSDKPAASGMSKATRTLHETLIRLCKGILKAWETWLSQQ